MTVSPSLLLDLALLLILVLCFVQGVRRGFILTLCSLLAVILALVGGWYLAQHYSQPVQEYLEPKLLERMLPSVAETQEDPSSLADSLQEKVQEAAQSAQTVFMTQQARALASAAAHVLLFLGGFIGVLLLWVILCHALDLVAKLPGLNLLNKVMGGVLGLVKGLILLLVLRWLLCDVLELIPAQTAEGSYVFSFLSTLSLSALPDISGGL